MKTNEPRQLAIAFLSTHDMAHEERQFAAGAVPSHRLFGRSEVVAEGFRAAYLAWPRWWPRRLRVGWRVYQATATALRQRSFSAVLCVTEGSAPLILALRRLGFLRTPVTVLTVAALKDANLKGVRGRSFAWLMRGADQILTYASAQIEPTIQHFGVDPNRVGFVPFGVDVDFFSSWPVLNDGPDVLSVGTNEGKDFATLLQALPSDWDCVIITDEFNRSVIQSYNPPAGVRVLCAVPITDIRQLYRSAKRVVIPLKNSLCSSGQTVLLENLALGRSVITADVPSIADYKFNGVFTYPAGDPEALRQLLLDPRTLEARGASDRWALSSTRLAQDLLASMPRRS